MNPGTWTVIIEAEGILLVGPPLKHALYEQTLDTQSVSFFLQDYLVLLPSAYYEAPILQLQVTEPCSYSNTQAASQKSVVQCAHIPVNVQCNCINLSFVCLAVCSTCTCLWKSSRPSPVMMPAAGLIITCPEPATLKRSPLAIPAWPSAAAMM